MHVEGGNFRRHSADIAFDEWWSSRGKEGEGTKSGRCGTIMNFPRGNFRGNRNAMRSDRADAPRTPESHRATSVHNTASASLSRICVKYCDCGRDPVTGDDTDRYLC